MRTTCKAHIATWEKNLNDSERLGDTKKLVAPGGFGLNSDLAILTIILSCSQEDHEQKWLNLSKMPKIFIFSQVTMWVLHEHIMHIIKISFLISFSLF